MVFTGCVDQPMAIRSGDDEIEYTQGRAAGDQLQSFRDARVGFVVSVALVPGPVAGQIGPVGHQPDFIRHVLWAQNVQAHKPWRIIDEVRAE